MHPRLPCISPVFHYLSIIPHDLFCVHLLPFSSVSSVAMSDPGEPGMDTHPPGGYTVGMFIEVSSVNEFAAALDVPEDTIELVVPLDTNCRSRGCQFKAIAGNYKYCAAHCRTWYPLPKERGSQMLGPDYIRWGSGKLRTCDCSQGGCFKGGYFPKHPAIYISKEGHQVACGHTNLLSHTKQAALKADKGEELYFFPWHFYPEHR